MVCNDCTYTYTNENTPYVNLAGRRILLEEEMTEQIKPWRFLFSEETKQRGPNHLMHFLTPYRSLQSTDPQIPNPTTVVNYGGSKETTIKLRGLGFGPGPILWIGEYRLSGLQFKFANDTYIEFLFPYIPAGEYIMRIEAPGKGFSQAWKGYVQLNAWGLDISPAEVSQGGQIIVISGSGLSNTTSNPTQVDVMLPGTPD